MANGIGIINGFDVNSSSPIDKRYGVYTGNTLNECLSSVITSIPSIFRHEGLSIGVKVGNNDIVEYWFVGGIADDNLKLKSQDLTGYSQTGHTHHQLHQPNGTNPFVYTDNSGTLHVDGNIVQSGSTWETHVNKIYTTGDTITLRDGAVASLGVGEYAGLTIKKYDGLNDGSLKIDKDGWVRVGDVGNEQKVATIEESTVDNYIMKYNASTNRLEGVNPAILTGNIHNYLPLSGGTLTGGLTGTTITTTDDIYINSLRIGRGGGAMTNNLGIGNNTLLNNTSGNWNIAIGGRSLEFNTTGGNNAAIGGGAMMNNTTGIWNVAIGTSALRDNTTGQNNIGIGGGALSLSATNSNNTAIGAGVLGKLTGGGTWNVGVGRSSLFNLVGGDFNIALGGSALGGLITGASNNIAIGHRAARTIDGTTSFTNANNSIYIGNDTLPLSNDVVNEIVIGNGAKGNGTNTVTIGNDLVDKTYLNGDVYISKESENITLQNALDGKANQSDEETFDNSIEGNAIADVHLSAYSGEAYYSEHSNYATMDSDGNIFTEHYATKDDIVNRYSEIINQNIDGVNRIFTLSKIFISGSVVVYLNGIRERYFSEIQDNKIEFEDAPQSTGFVDLIEVEYMTKE